MCDGILFVYLACRAAGDRAAVVSWYIRGHGQQANRKLFRSKLNPRLGNTAVENLLANRTNGPAYATVPSPSVAVVCLRRRLSVTLCIAAKRCVLEQMLLLTVYRKSYMRNRLVPKRMILTFVRGRLRPCQPLRHIRH